MPKCVMMILDSVDDLLAYVDQTVKPYVAFRSGHDPKYYGKHNWRDTLTLARSGDDSYAARVDAIVDNISNIDDTPTRQWLDSPAGAYPIVPNVLAGMPDNMRRQIYDADQSAPINFVANLACPAFMTPEMLENRGIGILAVIRKAMLAGRPIELTIGVEYKIDQGQHASKAGFFGVKVPLEVISYAHLCFMIINISFTRRILHGGIRAGLYDNLDSSLPHVDDYKTPIEKLDLSFRKRLREYGFSGHVLGLPYIRDGECKTPEQVAERLIASLSTELGE